MELRVLLDPGISLQDWPEPPLRVTFLRHKNLSLCSLLPNGSLHLTIFDTGTPQGFHAHLDGPFIQFRWEDGNGGEAFLDRNPRLLTLSQDNTLCVYDVSVAGGRVDLTRACLCDKASLRQLCAESHVCIPSLLSVRLLSLCYHDIVLLVSNSVLVHLRYNAEEQKPKIVSCLCLELEVESAERISDVCLNHEILFLLDNLGFIYAFDILDGSPVIVMEVPVRTDFGPVELLNCLYVSPNLDLMVVSSGSSYFLPIKLSKVFSEDATLCLRIWRNQHHLNSSQSNVAEPYSEDIHGYPIASGCQMDRSWDAILSSLSKETKRYSTFPVCPSAQSLMSCVISTDAPLNWAVLGAGWVKIHTDNMNNPVRLHSCSLSSFSALFSLSDIDGCATFARWDMETQVVDYHTLGKALCVDGADDEGCLIITDRGLSLVLFAVPQNEFLTRLMIHGSASTADTLCYLNNWGRCSVPIHTLEAGLENRQLDTVDFFLKSKESILVPLTCEDGSVQSEQYLHNVRDLVPALDLLFSFIKGTDQEAQSKHFSEQLLQLTLHFLNGQVLKLCNLLTEPDPGLEQCVEILSGYINKLRPFLRRFHQQPFPVQAQHAERVNKAWENMTVENIISDAIMSNCIPEAQSFLRTKGNHFFGLTWMKQEGLKMVFKCLMENKVTEACQLLQNMGYSIWEELRRICLYTSNLAVRDLLVDLLQRKGHFSVEEQERICTVNQLEKLCNDTQKPAGERLSQTYSKPPWKTGDLSLEEQGLQKALNYVRDEPIVLLLHWAQDWDSETQESILLPWKSNEDLVSVSPKILWRHLTLWHDWPRIDSWIDSIGHGDITADEQPSLWPPLSPAIIDENTLCCNYTRDKILNKLARKNIFIPSELIDFESLVDRLVVNHQLMLPANSSVESISAHYPDFHNRFVLLCVERGIQHLLYPYLDIHSLQPENCPALSDTSLHEAHPWFGFLVHIRQVSAEPHDITRISHASLSNAHVLMPGCQPSLSSMLLEGHTLLAMATKMFAPGGIDEVLHQPEESSVSKWNVDPTVLKVALVSYPKLKAAVLSPQSPNLPPPPPEITLYHLLQSLLPFHPSHFFTWQPTNPFATGDSITELPHFSCPRLVNKYAIQEQLDLFFYLRSGRPSMAFYTFIVNQLLTSQVPQQLIQQTAKDVYVLALSSYSVPSIIASCVCFLELLGVSSRKLRVDVNVANIILKNTTSNLEEQDQKSHTQEIAQRLLKLVDNETEAAKDLLMSLEEVVAVDLEKEDSNPCNGLWVTALQFCHLHSVPANTLHLRHFAQKQDWLQLLVHANNQEQVFSVLNDLNPVLASHVTLALQGKGTTDCTIQETDMETNPDTVHHVLQKCLNMAEPEELLLKECVRHGVPLFSVLATCTSKNADIVSCMCAWIITSVDAGTQLEITQTLSTPADHKWKLEDLTQIWIIVLERKDSRTLHKAFSIFMEDCPLLLLLETFELCMENKDYPEAKGRILEFQKKVEELQSLDDTSTLPVPVVWLQTQASHLLRVLILQSRTSYEVQKVFQLLCDSDCQPLCADMDIHKLRALTEIIEDQPFFISRELLSDYCAAALQEECQRLLQILVDEGQFSLAHQVAQLAELPTDNLVIEEVLHDRRLMQELEQWECPQSRAQYWKKCHEIFNIKHLSPAIASSFFQSQASQYTVPTVLLAEKNESLVEQELLLTLAGHWLSKDDSTPLVTLEELEQQVWKCCIEREILDRSGGLRLLPTLSVFTTLTADFSFSTIPVLNSPQLLDIATLPLCNTIQDTTGNSQVLSSLIDRLLDASRVHEASRVCRYFQLSHLDLRLVLSCRALASGEASIHQLHPDIQNILAERIETQDNIWSRRKRLQRSSSVESPSTCSPTDSVIMNLEILKDTCKHGKAYCRQLLCMYELSKDLGCSFSEVSSRDPSEVLRIVLSKNRPELADRAQAIISSHGLAPETVAQIVAEECLKLWRTLDKEGGQTEMYNVSEKRANFLQLAKLCPDPTLVGLKLLDHLETVPVIEIQSIIEVLISAHDCFSLTCHLEGIRRVLHVCRHLTEMHLAPKQAYSLMVRLLSGIGRYNDMVYVFDILHKNQHFELLLRKQLDTKGGLQTALLEYIKRCHPGDSEKHNMTALCFSLHRDIAHNHEHAAKIQLRLIQSKPWEYWISELEELKASIMKALTLLIDASESYSKDSCVRQSLRCARLTRLLTLQLHLLKSGHKTRLINLDRENLMEPIMALPRFYQAVIITEAYDVQPDWAEVLYNKVILGGDFQYLDELKQRQLLSKGVFEQISHKCKLNTPGAAGLQHLKRVISMCKDINLRYNLAIEYNFYDITDVLMRDSQTRCCLTDMLSH